MATTDRFLELFKNNSIFWSKLGWAYDPPRTDENGKQIMFFADSRKLQKFHKDFYNAGIKIHSTIISSGWVDTHRFDYTETDRTLKEIFECGEDLLYIPRIKLNVPLNWGKENPEEICVYYPGNLTTEEIRQAVNTPAHDIIGRECSNGYDAYAAWLDAWRDDRPNLNGLISNQSFSSKKWLADAGDALVRFIRHLEGSRYSDRIIGYHFGYGMCGETSLWRTWKQNNIHLAADYGIGCRRAFFDWGLKKYSSLEILRTVWNQDEMTRENVKLPSPDEREFVWKSASDFFRAHPKDVICIDYERFMGDMNVDGIEYFGKIIKEESGKPSGAFYGYYLNVARSAYTGHLAFDRVLNSPHIDFLVAPKAYRRVAPGEPGGEQVPAMSVNRKKLFIDELDNRTHLSKMESENMFQTRSVLWREFAKNMMYKSSFWWMDIGGGWFDSPDILNEISKIESVANKLRNRLSHSISEVLIVTDENSFLGMKANSQLHTDLLVDSIAEINLCGTPVDHYRWNDLKTIDLSSYKCIFFMNCIEIKQNEWKQVRSRLRLDAYLCWHYAPGIRGQDYDLCNIAATCGVSANIIKSSMENIHIEFLGLPDTQKSFSDCSYPLFEIVEDDFVQIIGRYSNGKVAVGSVDKDGHKNIYICTPILHFQHYRKIMNDAGVTFYAPEGSTIYADNRFLGIFSCSLMEFELCLPNINSCQEALSGEIFKDVNILPVKMQEKDARFYIFGI